MKYFACREWLLTAFIVTFSSTKTCHAFQIKDIGAFSNVVISDAYGSSFWKKSFSQPGYRFSFSCLTCTKEEGVQREDVGSEMLSPATNNLANSRKDVSDDTRPACSVLTNMTDSLTSKITMLRIVIISSFFLVVAAVAFPRTAVAEQWDAEKASALAATIDKITTTKSATAMPNQNLKYWDAINTKSLDIITTANERLLDYAVGTINTMYYDNTGGLNFYSADMFDRWKALKSYSKEGGAITANNQKIIDDAELTEDELQSMPKDVFSSWEGAVSGIKWLVSTLNDPYSKFLTREELREELNSNSRKNDGFLGLGAIVEVPLKSQDMQYRKHSAARSTPAYFATGTDEKYLAGNIDMERLLNSKVEQNVALSGRNKVKTPFNRQDKESSPKKNSFATESAATNTAFANSNVFSNQLMTSTRVDNLPIVMAVSPDSPAERSGLVVGDRIVAIGSDKFLGMSRKELSSVLRVKYNAENYAGYPDITVAKPVYTQNVESDDDGIMNTVLPVQRSQLAGYRLSRVRLPTVSLEPFQLYGGDRTNSVTSDSTKNVDTNLDTSTPILSGGNSVCHYELLTPDDSIFSSFLSTSTTSSPSSFLTSFSSVKNNKKNLVGYIRLTRFSRASTLGYFDAVNALEKAGASSYIIDLRNNYGGVIQESMLTASTLLRDPSTVLCYTINSRGGFTPHDVEEYIVDRRYPGYLLSTEDSGVTLSQVRRNNPNIFYDNGEWKPPSQFASLHEQGVRRGRPPPIVPYADPAAATLRAQKKIVLLVNEGTASSAEVFVSSLHDNGRLVSLVGAKTYGKGLIQHTFPMPDGSGLRITVAEYLTPALQHVTKVGSARYEAVTGEYVGGGVRPDVYCESRGIPSNPGADICVGMALDTIADAELKEEMRLEEVAEKTRVSPNIKRRGDDVVSGRTGGTGISGAGKRRVITAGVVKDDF